MHVSVSVCTMQCGSIMDGYVPGVRVCVCV